MFIPFTMQLFNAGAKEAVEPSRFGDLDLFPPLFIYLFTAF
jgi:hypothetical protein